jgi:hypothetical protein
MEGNFESSWMDYLRAFLPLAAGPDWRGCLEDWPSPALPIHEFAPKGRSSSGGGLRLGLRNGKARMLGVQAFYPTIPYILPQ